MMTDTMWPFSSATCHLLHTSSVFICLFDVLPSPSAIWINVSLYAAYLIIFLSPLGPLCVMYSCVCVYLCEKRLDSSTYLCALSLLSHFPSCPYPFFSPSEIRWCHPTLPLFRYHSSLQCFPELRFDALSTLSLSWIFCLSFSLQTPSPLVLFFSRTFPY